jgi:dihydrofolate reductase
MAISQDGFIAGENDETPWSNEEWQAFQNFVKSCDVVLLGKRTFKIMQQQNELVDGPRYIVVTNDKQLDSGVFEKLAIHSKEDLPQVNKLGIIGGGDLNGRLAELGAIDEIILDREPVKLHEGITLFGRHNIMPKLQKISSKQIGKATTQDHYRVIGWQ